MKPLNELSQAALSAAMRGGTDGWGQVGSAAEHIRYMEPLPKTSRRRCCCGCGTRNTHAGRANGMTLMCGCQLRVARWVRDGRAATKISTKEGA